MELTEVQQKTIDLLKINPKRQSPKGWILGGICPFCHRNDKFGIKLNNVSIKYDNHISFNCFHGSCLEKGGEFLLFQALGEEDFLKQKKFIKYVDKVENKIKQREINQEEPIDLRVVKRNVPFGWRRVYDDPYLESRGWEEWQYHQIPAGRTKLFGKLKDYIILLVEEDGENKGYVARLIWSKEKIKAAGENAPPRYRNEGGVDFAKLLGGIDEVTEETTTIIIVEGLFDKTNVDKQLKLNLTPQTKCLYSFGKKLSDAQIEKIRLKSHHIREAIFLYDPDGIDEIKRYGQKLKDFMKVGAGFLFEKDPGELTAEELETILQDREDIGVFSLNKVQKKKLK